MHKEEGKGGETVTTPRSLIFIVVGTLCVMAFTYVGTLAYCVVSGAHPEGDLMRAFEAAGIYVLGAVTGILVNTRSPHGEGKEVTISATTTTTETKPDP